MIREILLLWGIESAKVAPWFARQRALNDLNSAMQMVWNQARDRNYWTRSTLTIPLSAGIWPLPDTVQNVLGPLKLESSRRPLMVTQTLNDLERFVDTFCDGEIPDEPSAFFIQRENQAKNDSARAVLYVSPAPVTLTNFLLDVVLEAPRYSQRDVEKCTRIPMPHRYVESLLIPIVRYKAMSFHLFVDPDRKPLIEADFQDAMAQLDAADPAGVSRKYNGREERA
ncbi:MAG: hypothetical protein QM627_00010 [Luteolibacter sp.]